MFKGSKPTTFLYQKSFTLVELIIVVIIVGILASLGLTQYSSVVERSRLAEARTQIGVMRQLAYEYYLNNGTMSGITSAYVGVGSGQIPNSAVSTHYFYYGVSNTYPPTADYAVLFAVRCTSGGKPPQFPATYTLWWKVDSSGVCSQYAYQNTGSSTVVSSNWSGCCR